jgi:tRNA(His) guanylyltransferase
MKDDLGNRIKEYESVTNYKLIRKGYTIIRIDGKAFHTYTKGLDKPFDNGLIEDMDNTAKYLCKNIQNVVCGYVQSDEITLVLCDFDKPTTSAWFDNKIQKMASVSASMATAKFNQLRSLRDLTGGLSLDDYENYKLAEFDARVFQLPTKTETINMLIWRQQDTVKNSITAVANTKFSHKELQGKNGNEKQEMMFQKDGTNWNDFEPKYKRGRMIVKENYEKEPEVFRTRWVSVAPPTFTKDRKYLDELIPTRDIRGQQSINWVPKELDSEEIKNFVKNLKNQITHYSNLLSK